MHFCVVLIKRFASVVDSQTCEVHLSLERDLLRTHSIPRRRDAHENVNATSEPETVLLDKSRFPNSLAVDGTRARVRVVARRGDNDE